MQVDLCRHIKTNGLQCRGAALCNSVFCYFHSRLHNSHELYRNKVHFQSAQIPHPRFLQLPAVEDRESAQLAISCVINALATGCITPKEANSLFYGLQLAAANARGLRIVRRPTQIVRDVYKEPWVSIPDASPDIAPPGRTCEIADPAEIPVTGAPGSTVSSSTLGLPPTETPAPIETHLPEEPAQPTTDNEEPTPNTEKPTTPPVVDLCAVAVSNESTTATTAITYRTHRKNCAGPKSRPQRLEQAAGKTPCCLRARLVAQGFSLGSPCRKRRKRAEGPSYTNMGRSPMLVRKKFMRAASPTYKRFGY